MIITSSVMDLITLMFEKEGRINTLSSVSAMSKGKLDEVAIDMVCSYMLQQNRPYSAVDVWNNLRQEYPKTQIIKCLDIGVERGVLREKLISKQKIYFADQDKIEKCDEAELQVMNESITRKKNRLNELNNEIKTAKNGRFHQQNIAEGVRVHNEHRRDDCAADDFGGTGTGHLEVQPERIKEMEERLGSMETGAKNEVINEKMKSELIAKQDFYEKQYKKRKQIADQIIDAVCENMNISKKKLMEDMGFELD
ncbi:unnamed protein product [Litomosoides sigmodontis]|uniref:Homologous-pairing protein 2 winged helix domain-containing protein n=1 Tax=Litomosoides sigmodontis TaxID=42156 RepID=A0A3P6U629_LITSI|nr:unnamed protein product [Litomosoides sigmodontis]